MRGPRALTREPSQTDSPALLAERDPRVTHARPTCRWGKCYSVCTAAGGHPNLWGELSVWGDSISLEVAWDADFTLGSGCTGSITASLGGLSSTTNLPESLAYPPPPSPPPALCNVGYEVENHNNK